MFSTNYLDCDYRRNSFNVHAIWHALTYYAAHVGQDIRPNDIDNLCLKVEMGFGLYMASPTQEKVSAGSFLSKVQGPEPQMPPLSILKNCF